MRNDPLDPADLLRFAAVADAGSFQAAADRLHVDRSVLSRRGLKAAGIGHGGEVQQVGRVERA